MPSQNPLNVAFVGCGNIAGHYATSLKTKPELVTIAGAYDIAPEASAAFAEARECGTYDTFDAVLADDSVDLVVNLTIQEAHYEVSRACLEAGKHVHSEKPLSITREEATALVSLADELGMRLSCAPFTWMGESQQTAWKTIRDGKLGEVRLVYAEMNWGRIESWHPSPANFYRPGVGPLPDVGVYPLSMMTAFFGPVRQVRAFADIMLPERAATDGSTFEVGAPDVVIAVLEFHSGVVARLTPPRPLAWGGCAHDILARTT